MDGIDPSVAGERMKPGLRDGLRESIDKALKIMSTVREAQGQRQSRRAVTIATLSISIAFLIGLPGVQHLDTPLILAAIAVGFAIPLLGMALRLSYLDFTPEAPEFTVKVLKAAHAFCQGIGVRCGYFALAALLWHLNPWAAIASFVGLGLSILSPSLVLVTIILRWAMLLRNSRAGVKSEVICKLGSLVDPENHADGVIGAS